METAARLMTLQHSLTRGPDSEELERQLAAILHELLPPGQEGPASGTESAARSKPTADKPSKSR